MSIRLSRIQNALGQYYLSKKIIDELSSLILDLPFKWQDYVFNQILIASQSSPDIAYQFGQQSEKALNLLEKAGTEQWLNESLDCYQSGQIDKALTIINSLDSYIADIQSTKRGLRFEDIRFVLQHFIYGLDGRHLEIRVGDETYTDSEVLYLPAVIDFSSDNEFNFNLFKAYAVHQWAQCWYGTWRFDQFQPLLDNPQLTVAFHRLESERLNACIRRDYPGLARQLNQIGGHNDDIAWTEMTEPLRYQQSDVTTTFDILKGIDPTDIPAPLTYQGCLKPGLVKKVQTARIEKQKKQLLDKLSTPSDFQAPAFDNKKGPETKDQEVVESEEQSPLSRLDFTMASLPVDEDLQNLVISIKQDLGEIPSSYSISASSSHYAANLKATQWQADDEALPGDHEDNIEPIYYDEWDCTRQAHRKQWCTLYEKPVSPDFDTQFVTNTLHKYRRNIRTISRSFEALRDEYSILRRQPDGDRLDLDALVEAMSDIRTGKEMSSRIYRKSIRQERNIAVVFMVDMSGSTKGWINTAQREALILLSEALQTLDDRYAIYGFSSKTRKHCELYTIKTFDDQYDETIKARIAAIEPHDYTRMGATIRHLTQLLDRTRARRKLLITLSDGKPDDYDSYHGEYGIEDTRMALLEARAKSIHSFCITIDEKAREYLPHMFGASNYILIDDVEKLPYRLSDVYRGLTS